ncbi:MAG: class I SAM-dependent methyltransferase [Chloroflexota bacterium]|nr:class I SAM-dependent methyltransferase [Chloroflexota bacterium]
MNSSMNTLEFNLTSLWFKLRDLLSPPEDTLSEVGIEAWFCVLDYGCGPGSYSLVAAQWVDQSGKVYAADINAIALKHVQKVASKRGLTNVETIHTDCATDLPSDSVDAVLLYDTYHDLTDPDAVLEELHRVLKPGSILSCSDHHMTEENILTAVTKRGLFGLSHKGKKTYQFLKVDKSMADHSATSVE